MRLSIHKPNKMGKQIINDFRATNAIENRFEESEKNIPAKKNTRYIYTEEDLGEGILDVGVNAAANRKEKPNSQLWTSMLKPYWP
jgi:hypothetical protein